MNDRYKEGIVVIIREEMEHEQVGWVGSAIAFSPSRRDAEIRIAAMKKEHEEWSAWLRITAKEETAQGKATWPCDVDESDRGLKRRQMMMDPFCSAEASVRYTFKELTENVVR